MNRALHAEWTKLRTTPGIGWLLLAAVAVTVGLSAFASGGVTYSSMGIQDPVKIGLTGIQVGQAIVALLGVLLITGEYSTGMIRTTLTAMPRRWTVLGAKAAILSLLVLVAGIFAVLGSALAGRLILPGNGFSAANGFSPLSLADGPTLRATAGSVLYLVLIGLLSLGIATLIRDPAPAVGVVLGLLYLFPILIQVVSDPDWKRHLQQIAPTNAGLAIQSTVDLQGLAISPWAGLGVLTAWSATALIVGFAALHIRDA